MLLQISFFEETYGLSFLVATVIVVFILFLIPLVFFLLTQQRTLKLIQPQNRNMAPGQVWLQLIPVFGVIWQFFVVSRIADSIQREMSSGATFSFEDATAAPVSDDQKPTYSIGIAFCILFCTGLIPMLGLLTQLAGIVCWIIYWVKLSDCKKRLEQLQYSRSSQPVM